MKPRILASLISLVLIAQPGFAQDEPKRLGVLPESGISNISNEENELLNEAFNLAAKDEIETSRFLFNSIIEGYGKSSGALMARLALADSYYFAGGLESLSRAEAIYREWFSLNQDEEGADQVLYRIAQIEIKMQFSDRDSTLPRVEGTLNLFLKRFPKSPLRPQVEDDLYKLEEKLGDQHLGVAKFYFTNRGAMAGAEDRLKEILEKYKDYSKMDEVLLLLGKVESAREDNEQSAIFLRLLINKYPDSKYRMDACDQLWSNGESLPYACR